MMNKQFFVIGDIHGEIDMMKEVITKWNKQSQQLILIGDLIDRGPDSKSCLLYGQELVEKYGAIWLKGNHEVMFLSWLDNPNDRYDYYRRNGGDTTINSLLGRPLDHVVDCVKDAKAIQNQYGSLIHCISKLPLYVELGHYIFVHAGVNLALDDWRQSQPSDFVWIRHDFHQAKNNTNKTIVFGHTPTETLVGESATKKLWIEDHKIGIDGGAVYHGVLHGVSLDDQGVVDDYIVVHKNYTGILLDD